MTTNGPLSDQPYFIRLSKTGDPNAAITYNLGNGGPTLDQRSVIDAGFLELVRLGELSATDPDVRTRCRWSTRRSRSRPRADRVGCATTATATATAAHRPTTDCTDSSARRGRRANKGTGHPWPVLSAERGEQDLATGQPHSPASCSPRSTRMSSRRRAGARAGLGRRRTSRRSPYGTDPTTASIGFANGKPDGSAAPLTWGAASQVRLAADLSAGQVLETAER